VAGVGINLQCADTVFLLTTDFNPHVEMQAIARVWRMGQRSAVRAIVITSPLNEHEARLQKIQYAKLVATARVFGKRSERDRHAGRLAHGRELFKEEKQARRAAASSQKTPPSSANRKRSRPSDDDEEDEDADLS
jgi:hypothetical protein